MKKIKSLSEILLIGLLFTLGASAQKIVSPEANERFNRTDNYLSYPSHLQPFGQKLSNDGSSAKFDDFGQSLARDWIQEANISSRDGSTGDLFGYTVSISGNTAIVGSVNDDIGMNPDQGSAYIFVRVGKSWIEQTQLVADDGAAHDNFGGSVAIDGNTVIVGATGDVGANSKQGKAYIFVRNGTQWTQQAQLAANDGAAQDFFGKSVAISGDTVIIGSPFDDVGANPDQGSAYIFARSGINWTQQTIITANDGATGDGFGNCVAISGNSAIVGAYFDDVGVNVNQGSAYVFARSRSGWSQQAQFTAPTTLYGNSVAIDGDTAVVGAFGDDIASNQNQGSAYIYARSGIKWTQQSWIKAADGNENDNFGSSVSISGNSIIVGANSADIGDNINQGSAYIFERNGDVWMERKKLVENTGTGIKNFGISAAISSNKVIVGAFSSNVELHSSNAKTNDVNQIGFNQGSAIFFVNAPLSPTVSVSGRITDSFGRGIANASISATNSQGDIFTTNIRSNGSFVFGDLPADDIFTIRVSARRYRFALQTVNTNENLTGINFIGR